MFDISKAGFSAELNILMLAAYEQARRALRGECEPTLLTQLCPSRYTDLEQKKKDFREGNPSFFGRSGGTRTHGLQYPKLARYHLRYASKLPRVCAVIRKLMALYLLQGLNILPQIGEFVKRFAK